ncbi:MAG: hypothetical protein KGI49_03405 [Patescibacteria group bacterium]|nr:hypothetical protein [Patescibacteria group bacterium]
MSKMTGAWWIFLFVFSGVADFLQFFVVEPFALLAGLGAGINEVLDPIVGSFIGGCLWFKKVPLLSRPKRIMALGGAEVAAAVSAGVAQLWILSVWYIFHDVRKDEASMKAMANEGDVTAITLDAAFNQNGRREPYNPDIESGAERNRDLMPANFNGVRRAGRA